MCPWRPDALLEVTIMLPSITFPKVDHGVPGYQVVPRNLYVRINTI